MTWAWLRETLERNRPHDYQERLDFFQRNALYADEDAEYAARQHIDLSALEPMVSCPHNVDNVQPLSALGKDAG